MRLMNWNMMILKVCYKIDGICIDYLIFIK